MPGFRGQRNRSPGYGPGSVRFPKVGVRPPPSASTLQPVPPMGHLAWGEAAASVHVSTRSAVTVGTARSRLRTHPLRGLHFPRPSGSRRLARASHRDSSLRTPFTEIIARCSSRVCRGRAGRTKRATRRPIGPSGSPACAWPAGLHRAQSGRVVSVPLHPSWARCSHTLGVRVGVSSRPGSA